MQISRKMLLGLVLGAAVVGSMGSVAAQSGDDPSPSPSAEVEKGVHFMGGHGHGRGGKAIRSESVLPPAEEGGEFRTLRTDSGTLDSIDGNTLTIAEEDGEKVEVTITDDTDVRRDGEEAGAGDLEEGDHVRTHRVKEGDGEYATEHVGALSAEKYAEMEAQRQACEDDPSADNCGPTFRHRFGGRPGMNTPDDWPAIEESSADAA
ncbi:MAG: hypothetical protein WD646_07700 [Actinomycetota bacterium]